MKTSLNITQDDVNSIIAAAEKLGAGPGMDHPHRGDLAHYQARMANAQKALAHMLAETYCQKFDWSDLITALIDHIHNSAIEQALEVCHRVIDQCPEGAGSLTQMRSTAQTIKNDIKTLRVIPTHQ